MLIQLRKDVKKGEKSTILIGVVSGDHLSDDMPIVVAAYSKEDGKRTIVHYTTLHEPGPYELITPVGTHNVVAFGDKNKNLIYDNGEPAGQILKTEQVSIPAGGVSGHLDIILSMQNSKKFDLPVGFQIPPKKYNNFHSTCPGAMADLEGFLFSDKYGKKGFWSPLEFFMEISGNIYFLEEYDPEKIPILFVHGASGSPQNWRTFFESIDRNKYQPWFYYYPSGNSINSMSHLLLWKLENLYLKYKFRELYITAHSMGGLVARFFLVNHGHYFPLVTNFISISTPWGGEALAESGVKYSPAVIPAWIDMQPDGEFITSLFKKKMPPGVAHYLFFGHKGNRNILRPNNDNIVTLESQLDQRSQMGAKMVYGFNEDHVSILSSKQVIYQYNAILADIDQKSKGLDKISGNRLHIDFSFDLSKEMPSPGPSLFLYSEDKKEVITWIKLSPEDTGQEHGPFPSGNYEVSLYAPSFKPEPVSIPVNINGDTIPKLEFVMKPTGYIRGYVQKDARYIQLGKYDQPDTEVHIKSIALKGHGVNRTIIPLKGEAENHDEYFPEHYLSATDFTFKGAFFFFDLLPGEYELTINAEGYEPYSRTCNVVTGEYKNSVVVKLIKGVAGP